MASIPKQIDYLYGQIKCLRKDLEECCQGIVVHETDILFEEELDKLTAKFADGTIKETDITLDNFSRVVDVLAGDLSGNGTLEEQIVEYINSLGLIKTYLEADIWIEYNDNDLVTQYRIINVGKGPLQLIVDNLNKVQVPIPLGVETGLSREIEANVTEGGISSGDVFPENTPFTDMWQKFLVINEISGLDYVATPNSSNIQEVGTTINISEFTWAVKGVVDNLRLSDNDGQLSNEPVTGTSHLVSLNYLRSVPGNISWTLTGDDVSNTGKTTNWYYASFSGKNSDGSMPNEAEILAGTKVVQNVGSEITMTLNCSNTEWGWIAVADVTSPYTQWVITALNLGDIGVDSLMRLDTQRVSVNGVDYKVYIFNYSSEVQSIKLT